MDRTTSMDRKTAEQALRDFLYARSVDEIALGAAEAPVPPTPRTPRPAFASR